MSTNEFTVICTIITKANIQNAKATTAANLTYPANTESSLSRSTFLSIELTHDITPSLIRTITSSVHTCWSFRSFNCTWSSQKGLSRTLTSDQGVFQMSNNITEQRSTHCMNWHLDSNTTRHKHYWLKCSSCISQVLSRLFAASGSGTKVLLISRACKTDDVSSPVNRRKDLTSAHWTTGSICFISLCHISILTS